MVLGKFSLFLEDTLYSFFFLKQTVRLAINVIPFYSSESVTAHAPSLMLCMFSLPGVGGSLQPCACDSIFSLYRNFRSFVFFLYGHGEACDGPDGVDFGNFPLLGEHPRPRRHEDGGHEEVDHATVFVGSIRVAL